MCCVTVMLKESICVQKLSYLVTVSTDVHEHSEAGEMTAGTDCMGEIGGNEFTPKVLPLALHVSVKYNTWGHMM